MTLLVVAGGVQLVGGQTEEREVAGSNTDRTTFQSLKITLEVMPAETVTR